MATTGSTIISVPKPGRGAYKPDRPLTRNALVQAQVLHFAEADKNLPPELQTGIDIGAVTTEGGASAYIRRVTEAIHKAGGRTGKVQSAT